MRFSPLYFFAHATGERHEGGFEVDFFFAESGHFESAINEHVVQLPIFVGELGQGDNQLSVARLNALDERVIRELIHGVLLPIGYGDIENRALTHQFHDFSDGRIDGHHASVDDAYFVTDVGQLRQNVAGDDDRLAHPTQASQEVSHFDASARIEAAEWLVKE